MMNVYKNRLRACQHVMFEGTEYTLLDDYDGRDQLRAVKRENADEYFERRKEWLGNKESDRTALEELEVLLPADSIEPSDKIRFVTTTYDTLFEIPNFGFIKDQGQRRQAYYMGTNHFAFVGSGRCWHIAEYAEFCEKNRLAVTEE